jgi:hypothetical protein
MEAPQIIAPVSAEHRELDGVLAGFDVTLAALQFRVVTDEPHDVLLLLAQLRLFLLRERVALRRRRG